MSCWKNLPGSSQRVDHGDKTGGQESGHGAQPVGTTLVLGYALPPLAALHQPPSSKGTIYLFQVTSTTLAPWASFPELPKCRWAGEIVRLSAPGSTSPASRGRETFLLWKAWDPSLTTAPRSLLSNRRFPSHFSSSPNSGAHAGPTALSACQWHPLLRLQKGLSQGPLCTP